ncbi:MAG TPA: glycine cleavage T C-terminal barrel domain-containing protein [Bryobacteraceae bacterium]|jgi:aminomethyltransferase|nr:glycine cleavage T C-terminal barrel domain-containing protein [Bryobacteraceae bacterium]
MSTGYEALHTSAAQIDLSARGKIRVTGEDRARLLHAMSTNDIQNLPVDNGLYAFFLTAVGRVLADSYIYNLGEALFLDTEPETASKLADHLDKYIIADDAYLENETDQLACTGIEGPKSLDAAAKLGIPVPDAPLAVLDYMDGFVARVATTGPTGLRVFTRSKPDFDLPLADSAAARLVRMENALPRYGDDISERYLVQETQQIQAVHTNKGCYLGQEIVERVRSRGQVHRFLMPLRIHSQTPPAPGTKLLAGGQPAGEITSAAFSSALGEVVAFAYIFSEPAHAKQTLTLANTDPPVLADLHP